MTTRITADNIVAGTITSDRIAANAVTLEKIAVGTFGPRITGVVLPNSVVAVLPNGSENFTINGSNFQPGVQVYIGTTPAAAVTYISSTQLVVLVPVMSPGTYPLYVTNTDGGTAIRLLAITISTAPVWATDSVLPTQFSTLSLQLSAVSDSSVIYTLASGSSLPAGLSLSTAGVLSGTISNITSSTTYNFTVVATDLESQTNSRTFSVSITVGDLNFPAVTLLLQTGASLSRSTTVTDVATPLGTFTASGSPTFGSTSPYQPDGYWSNQFNGSTDFLTVANNAAFVFGTGDFTVEFWVFVNSISTQIFYARTPANGLGTGIGMSAAGKWTGSVSVDGASQITIISTVNVVAATWNHIALTRSSTTLTLWINGVSAGTATVSGALHDPAAAVYIGEAFPGVNYGLTNGYISNLRVVKGTAVYTGAFIPPTLPLTAIVNTGLLTCQSNRFKDNSTNNFTITANGTPLVSAETPHQIDGYWSNQFNGSTDYAGPANNAAFQFGANNFTIEFWFNQISRLASNYDGPFVLTGSMYFTMGNGPSGYAFVAPSQAYIILSNLPSLNTWHHMAIVRNGSTFTAYLNGVSMGTTTFAGALANPTGGFQVGWAGTFDSYFNGYISNFRAVNGTAVYTSNFTPPTAPLTAIAGTVLLTCQSNSFKDNSTNNFAITRNGSPSTKSLTKPFVSSITSNGAALFNGSSYLSSASSASFALGTNNFTIEMWVYLTTASGNKVAASFGNFATYDPLIGYLSGGTSFEIRLSSTASSWDLSNGGVLAYTLNLNSWTHIALVRNGSNIALYGNGSLVGSVTSSASIYQSGNNIFLGKGQAAFYFPGYIANYRFVRGTAAYTGNFTPPSNFLTTTGGTYPSTTNVNTSIASTDTPLLANFNDSTYSGASTLNTVTRNGNPSTGWVSPYQTDGYWGNFFNGTTDYLTVASNSGLAFGTNNFTIEFWAYLNTVSSTQIFYSSQTSGSYTVAPDIYLYNGKLYVQVSSTNPINGTGPTTLVANRWYHIALVRNTGTTTLYLNGVVEASFSDSNTYVIGTNRPVIGVYGYTAANYYLNGYLSNLRVVNGTAIVPPSGGPTAPLTPVTNTVLLTCQSNRFLDTNTQLTPKVITPTGTPRVDPYFYPSGFTAPAASPGAALFNGSSQYLTAGTSAALNPGAGNFTFECWIYATSTPTSSAIFSGNTSGLGVSFNASQLGVSQTGVAFIITDPASFTLLNQWVHVAVVRSGTTLSLYKNGSRVATTAASSTNFVTSTQTFIASNGTTQFPGYIANLRLINGGATVYDPTQTTITIPTSPVTATANTVLLLNLADSNYNSATNGVQNNTFIDESNYAFPITRNGTATQGSITPYWPNGQWSNYFNGSSYIRSPGFNFSTSDFTIELFLNTAFLGAGPQFLGGYDSTGNNYTITMQAAGLITYYLSSDGSNWNIAAGVSLGTAVANRWHHIVIARTGTTIRGYFDGVGGTVITTSAAIFNNATNFWLGAAGSAGGNLTGYLSNVRILNGSSAYNANQPTITVPGAPFATGTTNQVLLTCYSNRFIDANTATTAKAITVTGGAQVQAFQPFSPTASYTTALYGGSGYFNGSTDYLTTPITASGPLDISTTTTYTIEAWVYWTASAGNRDVWTWGGKQTGGPSSYYQLYWATIGNVLKWEQGSTTAPLITVTTSLTPTLNTWYHIAIVRSGSSITVYANGQSIGTGTYAPNDQQFAEVCVGSLFYNTGYVQFLSGYVSNFRFVKGTAVYTGAFTPPTAPVTAVTNTSLLLNMANAGIYDAAAQNVITTVSNAQASTTPTAQWPPTSMKFNGSTDYLTAPFSPSLSFGSSNFTIEAWVYFNSFPSNDFCTIYCYGATNGLPRFSLYFDARSSQSSPGLRFSVIDSGANTLVDFNGGGTSGWNINSWYHVAITRSTNTWTLYRNGISVGTTTNSNSIPAVTSNGVSIGKEINSSNFFNGSIQDLRITRGAARTIATPTAAFLTR
jgi:hypothetical protein